MKQTELIMGMPITIEILDSSDEDYLTKTFQFFKDIDNRFSTYKPASEITRVNNGLPEPQWSTEMRLIMRLCDKTKRQTKGYFDIFHVGKTDPSGLVKGWAINTAANKLRQQGIKHFYIEAGGDVQVQGRNSQGQPWTVGIRNPFKSAETIKIVYVTDQGVATSGTYIRGQHIYNPLKPDEQLTDIQSLTVIGPNIYEADRFATAAFAMGRAGVYFIENMNGFEAYMVDTNKVATYTSGFQEYTYA